MAALASSVYAQVFVTTFGIGNTQGWAVGKWFDLGYYGDKEEFIEDATEYATTILGDGDPELCFADHEASFEYGDMIREGGISEEIWQYLALNDHQIKMLEAYEEIYGNDKGTVSSRVADAEASYVGNFDNMERYAEHFIEQGEYLDGVADIISHNIDYASIAKTLSQSVHYKNGMCFSA